MEREIGCAVVEVIPTDHLVRRCRERLGDLSPEFHKGRPTRLSGVLVASMRGRSSEPTVYLDVAGIGRFVLVPSGRNFVGITYIPRIYCHVLESSQGGFVEDSVLDWISRGVSS